MTLAIAGFIVGIHLGSSLRTYAVLLAATPSASVIARWKAATVFGFFCTNDAVVPQQAVGKPASGPLSMSVSTRSPAAASEVVTNGSVVKMASTSWLASAGAAEENGTTTVVKSVEDSL